VDTASNVNIDRATRVNSTHSGIGVGTSSPLGATVQPGGVNFSVYSKNATSIELLLFDNGDAMAPSRVISLHPREHRTYHYWHVFVPDLIPAQVYGFRVVGPFDPQRGLRFDGDKVLLDPYARVVTIPRTYSRAGNHFSAMKSFIADPASYDWAGDRPLQRLFLETVIYEMHVKGFTQHPNSGVAPERAGCGSSKLHRGPCIRILDRCGSL
jgi:isoamylase